MAVLPPIDLEPIELPEPPGLFGGWGEKIEANLIRFGLSIANAVLTPLWQVRDNFTTYFYEKTAEQIRPLLLPHLDKIETIPGLPDNVRDTISKLRSTEPVTLTAIGIMLAMSALVGLLMGTLQPFISLGMYQSEVVAHSARMDPSQAIAAYLRGGISEETRDNQLLHGGWSEELKQGWLTLLEPLLGIGDLGRLFLRTEIGLGEFKGELQERGYTSEDINRIMVLLQVIPPLTDIIRMSVREAFTPEIVEQFELHAELPDEMVAWAEKQGLSREWAKAYWASHWELPPLRMGFEMMHREAITQPEMEMLIKAHDVSPFWRDKLLEISYSPYTRVDVRRMYKTGVIGKEEVKRTYLDLGYNEERAINLTAFTVALANATERDLTKTEVLYGYEHGLVNDGETETLLLGLGYDVEEVDYYKTRVNYKRWQAMVKEVVKDVGLQYVANQIDLAAVYARLGELNLPAEQMNRYVRQWDIKKQVKAKRLTEAQLSKFRTKKLISDGEFETEMSGLGYSEKYIKWFLDFIKG